MTTGLRRRVRNVEGIAIPVLPHTGPKPKRYPLACHGVTGTEEQKSAARISCIRCYRWPTKAGDFFKFAR